MWHVWFMGHITAGSGLRTERKKRPSGDRGSSCHLSLSPPLPPSLSVSSSPSISLCLLLSDGLFTSSSLLSLLPFFSFCLSLSILPPPPSSSPGLLSPASHWAVGIRGGFASASLSFSTLSFVRWRFNPFLTLHFHMLRQQSSPVAFFKIRFLSQGKEVRTGFLTMRTPG